VDDEVVVVDDGGTVVVDDDGVVVVSHSPSPRDGSGSRPGRGSVCASTTDVGSTAHAIAMTANGARPPLHRPCCSPIDSPI
jgi:hypothetical protein